MRTIKQFFFLISLFIGLILLLEANSSSTQATQYGEAQPHLQIWLDKKVKNPKTDDYVDNLSVNDYKFSPGEEAWFKIKVKNTGGKTFEKVKVKDYLPDYVELISGPIEIEYDDLKSDEAREFEIKVKVFTANRLPNQGIYCVINKAEAEASDQKDEDISQICLEKKVLGAEVQPEAGTNFLTFSLILLLISAVALIFEKKLKTVF